MNYISIPITSEQKDKLISFYSDEKIEIKADYVIFSAVHDDIQIFIYESKKGYKVLYQGENPLKEALIFFPDAKIKEKKEKVKTHFLTYESQIGSDEVGNGDVFGPLVVTACYFPSENKKFLDEFKIDDSKKLNDEYILKIVPQIAPHFKFCQYTLTPIKYNELVNKGYSMNKIKAYLHNLALLSLAKKYENTLKVIDQFCDEDKYYSYLSDQKEVLSNIVFHTKGESYYPSIALASMVARYSFLKEMEKMNKKYSFDFLKGAGIKVDEKIEEFIKIYGKDKLKEVAKLNFSNIKKYL